MTNQDCPGLCAESIVGWLAAVGATVLAGLRLHWTAGGTPYAVLSSDDVDPIDAIVESWPTTEALEDMPITEYWRQTAPMRRHVPAESFRERAQIARGHSLSWTLSSTVTDLHIDKKGEAWHGPFDASGPGTIKWLHHRLTGLHGPVSCSPGRLRDSLLGQATRVQGNGLGFDHARLGSLADKTERLTDPLVEILAFFGLALFPVRGTGVDERLAANAAKEGPRQRGWRRVRHGTARRFVWPAWGQPLDRAGIDALLDAWRPDRRTRWSQLGVHAGWQGVAYDSRDRSDPTRAYGSERL